MLMLMADLRKAVIPYVGTGHCTHTNTHAQSLSGVYPVILSLIFFSLTHYLILSSHKLTVAYNVLYC